MLPQPAVWVNPADGSTWTFVASPNGLSGLELALDAGGSPMLVAQWQTSAGGSSPLVANNVLYYAANNYRVWDARADTNHRYTTSRTIRDQMVAMGWVAEGYGPDSVIMCAP